MKQNQDSFNELVESKEKFIKYWAECTSSLQNTVIETVDSQNIPSTDRYFPEYLNWQYSSSEMNEEYM